MKRVRLEDGSVYEVVAANADTVTIKGSYGLILVPVSRVEFI